MLKQIIVSVILIAIGAIGSYFYLQSNQNNQKLHIEGHVHGKEFCSLHQIAEAECPWCDPSLIERLGFCKGHNVPEAFCSRCNPKLIAGFKAEKDWCAGHEIPESQCIKCKMGKFPPGEKRQ